MVLCTCMGQWTGPEGDFSAEADVPFWVEVEMRDEEDDQKQHRYNTILRFRPFC